MGARGPLSSKGKAKEAAVGQMSAMRSAGEQERARSSYQQMHMKMLQDRAGSGQGPMARQDAANDQRMNEYNARQAMQSQGEQERARIMQATNDMVRQGEQDRASFMQERASAQPSMRSTPTGRRRFSWQR